MKKGMDLKREMASKYSGITTKVTNTERQILITQFHPQNPNLQKIVDKHWNIIQYSRDCSELFKEKPIIGFRKLLNLRDKLTNAKCLYPEPKV